MLKYLVFNYDIFSILYFLLAKLVAPQYLPDALQQILMRSKLYSFSIIFNLNRNNSNLGIHKRFHSKCIIYA